MAETIPAPEPVINDPGGSSSWADMTPGQRVTFIRWAAERGYEPCGSFSYYNSDEPPELCQTDATRAALASGEPVSGPRGLFDFKISVDFLIGLAAILLAGFVLITILGKGARRLAPV